MDQASEFIANVAPDALAPVRILFIEHHAQRRVEGLKTGGSEIFTQPLNARLMADCGMRIRPTGRRIGWILAALAVDVIMLFGQSVIGFELVIGDWPDGRDPAVMLD